MHQALMDETAKNLLSHEIGKVERAIRESLHEEAFDLLLNPDIRKLMASQLAEDDISQWIIRDSTWRSEDLIPGTNLNIAERFLHSLWQELSLRISRQMEAVKRCVDIRNNGAVICFPGSVDLSLLVSYSDASSSGAVNLRPLAVNEAPQGMLDLEGYFRGSERKVKNAIKSAALTVDKITYHRGVITHVDRQKENVFGPTIDTILLADLLYKAISEHKHKDVSVLEVGPGSGLISAVAAKHQRVKRLVAIEVNQEAASCTLKNLRINGVSPGSFLRDIAVRAERFRPSIMAEQFDFVVCNPPYIPEVPSVENFSASGYGAAIGGLELYEVIFGAAEQLLSPDGRILIMTSSVSHDLAMSKLGDGFTSREALVNRGRRVPLDLDLLWDRPDWRAWLIEQRVIESGENGDLFHRLLPMWIERS